MKTKICLGLLFILLLGLGLRLAYFGSNPPSLYWDEVAIGLDARSLIQTGRDINNQPQPQPLFRSYGDYKAPVYIYLVAFLGRFFSVSPVIIRLPSLLAFVGILITWSLLVYQLTQNRSLTYLTALSLALMPWSIHFSRIAMESHLSLFWLSLSLLLLVIGLKRSKHRLIVFSGLTLVLGIYSYIALRIIGPAILLITYFIFAYPDYQKSLKAFIFTAAIIGFSIFFLVGSSLYSSSQNYRLSNDNLLRSTDYINQSVKAISTYPAHRLLPRLLHHRYFYWLKNYTANYLAYFSPSFLFFNGDPNLRHHSGYGGMLLLVQALFLMVGFFSLNKLKLKTSLFLVALFLLAPSVAALVNETPHASRSIYLILPLSVVIALGLNQVINYFRKHIYLTAFILSLLFSANLIFYLNDYWNYYPVRSRLAWINPYKQLFNYLKQSNFSQPIYISDRFYQPGLYAAYYLHIDPQVLQASAGRFTSQLGQLHFFLPDHCPDNSICIAAPDWQADKTEIVDYIPGSHQLVIKRAL